MSGEVLGQDCSSQMIEALDQPSASEGLRDNPGRRRPSQFRRGYAQIVGSAFCVYRRCKVKAIALRKAGLRIAAAFEKSGRPL